MVITRRQSGKLPASPKKPLRQEYAEGEEKDDRLKRSAKRPRVRSAQGDSEGNIGRARTSSTPNGKRRGNAGKLSRLNDISTDVFTEIAGYLHPLDILHMSRMSHQWRATLMSRQSKQIWHAARRTVEGLPACPSDLSEAEYARLLFEKDCYSCGTKNVPKGDFALRVRLCNFCARSNVISRSRFNALYPYIDEEVLFLVPYTNGRTFSDVQATELVSAGASHGYAPSNGSYLKVSVEAMAEAMSEQKQTRDEDEYEAWFEERQGEVDVILSHADEVEQWHRQWTASKTVEITALIAARKEAITVRFVALGYEEEDLDFDWDDEPLLQKPQQVTDRVWSNIRKKLEPHASRNREKRVKEERARLQATRQAELHPLYAAVVAAMPISGLALPTRMDFLHLPSVLGLWTNRAQPVPPDLLPTTDVVAGEMHELMEQMKRDVQVALVRAAGEAFPGEAEEAEIAACMQENNRYARYGHSKPTRSTGYRAAPRRNSTSSGSSLPEGSPQPSLGSADIELPLPPLDRATSIVACASCTAPLHWPSVLAHLRSHNRAADHHDHSALTFPVLERSKRWDPASVKASPLTQLIMRGILKAGGLGEDATVRDLERVPQLNCDCCGVRGLTWRAFFLHFAQEFRTETAAAHGDPTRVVKHAMGSEDFVTAFVPNISFTRRNRGKKIVECKLCGGSRAFTHNGLRHHLGDRHDKFADWEDYILFPV